MVNPTVVSAATLSILALVCFEMLNSRRQVRRAESTVQRLAETIGPAQPPSLDRVIAAAGPGLELDFDHARDLRLVGVTLSRTIRSCLAALERCLVAGGSVRVVIIDPMGSTTREAARRNSLPDDVGLFEHRLRPTIDLLRYLAARPGTKGRLQVRLASFVPSFGLTLVDSETSHGRLAVDVYSHRPGAREPVLALTAAHDPGWFRHFRAEFDQIWERARPLHSDPPGRRRHHHRRRRRVDPKRSSTATLIKWTTDPPHPSRSPWT
jgi:hypothetical protein